MDVKLSEKQRGLVCSIAQSAGLKNTTLNVLNESIKGEGYMGNITTLQFKSEEKTLNLIIKSAPTNEKLRANYPIEKLYNREIYMYEIYFPELEKLQNEYKIACSFKEIPKCFGTLCLHKEESIILENLINSGFESWNRKIGMDSEHAALVCSTYGKFHGVSYALKTLKPDSYKRLTKGLSCLSENQRFKSNIDTIFQIGFKSVQGNSKAMAALSRLREEMPVYIGETVEKIDDFSVVIHADCWCNNMMFKYNGVIIIMFYNFCNYNWFF